MIIENGSDLLLVLNLTDEKGNRIIVNTKNSFTIRVFTVERSNYLEYKKTDIVSTSDNDKLYLNSNELETLESGVIAYTYMYGVDDKNFNDGEYNNQKTVYTDYYFKNISINTEPSNPVKELDNLGDGSNDIIFIGLMDESDKDKQITYSYLSGLLAKDNHNNKVFEPTTLPITVRTNFEGDVAKAFFILVPKNHPNLYSLSSGYQCYTGWGDGEAVNIDFGKVTKPYKLFRFGNFNYRCNIPLTYTV